MSGKERESYGFCEIAMVGRERLLITIDEMQVILENIIEEAPEAFFRELNGGILLLPEASVAPEALENDLFTLGEYCEDALMGRYIILYYGSFAEVFREADAETVEEELRETLFHEFTHHLESLAGEFGLERKDAEELAAYFRLHGKGKSS